MSTIKTKQNKHGEFIYTRAREAETFECGRCGQEKTSKTTVEWTDTEGQRKVICNGCYGWLLADAAKS